MSRPPKPDGGAPKRQMLCSRCGAVLPGGATECSQCGAVYSAERSATPLWMWALAIGLLVAGIASVGATYYVVARRAFAAGLRQGQRTAEARTGWLEEEPVRREQQPAANRVAGPAPSAPPAAAQQREPGEQAGRESPQAAPEQAAPAAQPPQWSPQAEADTRAALETLQRAVAQFHSHTGAYPASLADLVSPTPPSYGLAPAADGSVVEVPIDPSRYRPPYLSPPEIPRNVLSVTPDDPSDDWIYETDSAATLGQVRTGPTVSSVPQ